MYKLTNRRIFVLNRVKIYFNIIILQKNNSISVIQLKFKISTKPFETALISQRDKIKNKKSSNHLTYSM